MGYTLSLNAISLQALSAELASPTIQPSALRVRDDLDDEVLQGWGVLATTMATALRGGGGEVVWPLAGYLQLVIQHLGHPYGSLWHTSSGGLDFRRVLLPGPVAAIYGPEVATHLVNRELFGLAYTGYPMFGWLSHAELQTLANVAFDPGTLDDALDGAGDDAEAVWTLSDAFTRAAATGLDLVTVYA